MPIQSQILTFTLLYMSILVRSYFSLFYLPPPPPPLPFVHISSDPTSGQKFKKKKTFSLLKLCLASVFWKKIKNIKLLLLECGSPQ